MTRPSWNRDEHDPEVKHDARGYSDGEPTDRDTIASDPNPNRRGKWLSVGIAALGVVTIGQTLALEVAASAFWNAFLVGGVLVLAGGYNYSRRSKQELGSAGVASLAAVAGLWLVASPFVIGPGAGPTLMGNESSAWLTLTVGLLALGCGSYSAAMIRRRRLEANDRRMTDTSPPRAVPNGDDVRLD
ncbi:DMT family transporter [Salinadaptatus halalkaliphilus]|uniref:DMT family transporter n=1 Tax=Salinadaptatus halalkaliphilus TaxID=2419781 RepID=A0A4S3TLA1_9EURY|nr:DMT family transporter [Salinadaptatus halalkaliphilus]THE63378.1 DMT family transporter [Salinadaptatus halalkaliphilus]